MRSQTQAVNQSYAENSQNMQELKQTLNESKRSPSSTASTVSLEGRGNEGCRWLRQEAHGGSSASWKRRRRIQ